MTKDYRKTTKPGRSNNWGNKGFPSSCFLVGITSQQLLISFLRINFKKTLVSVGFQILLYSVFTQNFLLCLLFSKASFPPSLFPSGGTAVCWRHIPAPLHSTQCWPSQNKQNTGSTSRRKTYLPRQTENPVFCYKASQSWFELNRRVKTHKEQKPHNTRKTQTRNPFPLPW